MGVICMRWWNVQTTFVNRLDGSKQIDNAVRLVLRLIRIDFGSGYGCFRSAIMSIVVVVVVLIFFFFSLVAFIDLRRLSWTLSKATIDEQRDVGMAIFPEPARELLLLPLAQRWHVAAFALLQVVAMMLPNVRVDVRLPSILGVGAAWNWTLEYGHDGSCQLD